MSARLDIGPARRGGGRWRKLLGVAGGLMMLLATLGRARANGERCRKLDFGTSAQKMGLRFSERLRDRFRDRWIRLRR